MELQPFMIWFLTYNENLYVLVSDIILCAVYYQLSCTRNLPLQWFDSVYL